MPRCWGFFFPKLDSIFAFIQKQRTTLVAFLTGLDWTLDSRWKELKLLAARYPAVMHLAVTNPTGLLKCDGQTV